VIEMKESQMFTTTGTTVERFIASSVRTGRTPETTIRMARNQHGEQFAKEVETAIAKGAFRPTVRSVHGKLKKIRTELFELAGIKPINIPRKGVRLQAAIQALVARVDEGKKPSALAAATQPGLDEKQIKRLAYRTPIKVETVQSAVNLEPESRFVQRLLGDVGLTGLVVDGHVNLSKLARVLSNANRSLAERVQHREAVVIRLKGEQEAQREKLAGIGGNSRGSWHAQAIALREQGKTGNQIARLLGKTPNAVEKVLSRKVGGRSIGHGQALR
jgi:hypothetical protein